MDGCGWGWSFDFFLLLLLLLLFRCIDGEFRCSNIALFLSLFFDPLTVFLKPKPFGWRILYYFIIFITSLGWMTARILLVSRDA